jgi:hypothetical protein
MSQPPSWPGQPPQPGDRPPLPGQPGGQPYGPGYPGQPLPDRYAPQSGPYGQSFGGPPPAPVGPPPKKSRRGRYVLIGVLVLLLGVVGFAAFSYLSREDPRTTADTFLAALKSKDFAAAQSSLCADGRRQASPDRLRDDFQLRDNTITAYTIVSEQQATVGGAKLTQVTATLTYQTGEKTNVRLNVVSEGGGSVCGFKIPA